MCARFGFDVDLAPRPASVPGDAWLRQGAARAPSAATAIAGCPISLVRCCSRRRSRPSKSDSSRRSVLWLKDRTGGATGSPGCSRTCRGSARRRCFWSFSATRDASSGSAHCADTGRTTARWKAFSTPRSTHRCVQTCVLAARRWLGTCPISVLRNRITEVAAVLELAGQRYSRSPGCASAIRRSRVHQHASAAGCDRGHVDRYDDAGLATRDGYDRTARSPAIRSRTASATPPGSAPPNSTAGRRTRRARRSTPRELGSPPGSGRMASPWTSPAAPS